MPQKGCKDKAGKITTLGELLQKKL